MKILVVYATAGAGHKKAAEAIFDGLQRQGQHAAVLRDVLDYTNPFFKKIYPSAYAFLVTRLPWVWHVFFGLMDWPWMQGVVRFIRRWYNGINTRAFEEFLIQEAFDCIMTTQFLAAEVCAHLKRRGKIKARIIGVVTDFDVHRIWINDGVDLYTVACDYTKKKIVSLGVPDSRVFITGIPVHASFSRPVVIKTIREKLGLKQGLVVLIATGSFGMGPIESLVQLLQNYQLLIICGTNRSLYDRLALINGPQVHVFGLVNNMHELMSVADVMVTKPGGLSIAEALVKKLPLIFFSAIPGQEAHNIEVLKNYGLSAKACSLSEIVQRIDDWNAHPEGLDTVRQRLAVLSKPYAVPDIIGLI